jgi:hypothetical protein
MYFILFLIQRIALATPSSTRSAAPFVTDETLQLGYDSRSLVRQYGR